jgi:hypothetical protein
MHLITMISRNLQTAAFERIDVDLFILKRPMLVINIISFCSFFAEIRNQIPDLFITPP